MRTRNGGGYKSASDGILFNIRHSTAPSQRIWKQKRVRDCTNSFKTIEESEDSLERLPDCIITSIISQLCMNASTPSDIINFSLTCRRFCHLSIQPQALRHVSPLALNVSAQSWSYGAFRFTLACALAGNSRACYRLGMIKFYCLEDKAVGLELMCMAAEKGHVEAYYSLAVIKFNGSDGGKGSRNLESAIYLLGKAAMKGHVPSLREYGHCLQDGFGVEKNVFEGRKLLFSARMKETICLLQCMALNKQPTRYSLPAYSHGGIEVQSCDTEEGEERPEAMDECEASFSRSSSEAEGEGDERDALQSWQQLSLEEFEKFRTFSDSNWVDGSSCAIYGAGVSCQCSQAPSSSVDCSQALFFRDEVHKFLVDWHSGREPAPGHRMCHFPFCGRVEMRLYEFRCCSACAVAYCSKNCQVLDWKLRHKMQCLVQMPPGLVSDETEEDAEQGVETQTGF